MRKSIPKNKKIEIGLRIIKAMADIGISSKAVAKECKVEQGSVARWRSGENTPTLDNLAIISTLTGKPVKYFLDGEDEDRDSGGSEMSQVSGIDKALAIIERLMNEKAAQALSIEEQNKRIKDLESTVTALKSETEILKKKLLQYKRMNDPPDLNPEQIRDMRNLKDIEPLKETTEEDDTGEPRRNFR